MTNELLQQIAEEVGTPVYVYDANVIASQYRLLTKSFKKAPIKIHYAMKALTNTAVLKLIRSLGGGLDAVSIEEVLLGLRAGFSPQEILFTPNGVAFHEIQEAVALGVVVNIDNLAILEEFGATYGNAYPVCVRLNPHIMAGGNANISVGHIDSKFGISIHQLRHIQRIVENYDIVVEGLHMHTGSDIVDPDVFLQGAELLYEAAFHFPNLRFLDFGSGFKIAYRPTDVVTPIEQIGAKIAASFNEFTERFGKPLELWFEPGKFLVSDAGNLLVSVNVVKQTTSTVFLGVDSGQNHLIRPMFYNAYHHIENISNPTGNQKLYSVVGYICETDTFGYDRMIAEAKTGDVLAIRNAGAYGFSMSNNYNSRLRPAEVMVKDGQFYVIRKRETLEDIVRNEVEIPLFQESTITT